MDGFTSRKEPWEWAWTIDTLSLLIFITFDSSLLLLAHVFNKIPTDPYGNYMAAIFGSHTPLVYATGVVFLSFLTSCSSLLLLLAHVFNKIPTDPYGNYGCLLWLSPPCLCNWSGNQVFLNFHSKSLVPTPAIGDDQKWSPQADLLYVKSARCTLLSPILTENIERMFIF